MRVMLWYWGRRGGGAHYTAGMAEALAAHPDVAVSASVSSALECLPRLRSAVPQAHVVDMHRPRTAIASLLRPGAGIGSVARRDGVDVVLHTMANPFTPLGMLSLRDAGIPVVFVAHDAQPHPGDRHRMMDAAVRYAARHSDRVIAATEHVAAQIGTLVPQADVDVVALGPLLDLPDLWDPSGPVVFLGRLRRYKGLDLLAEAWEGVARPGQVRLVVIGDGEPDLPELVRLRALGADVRVAWVPDDQIESAIRGARLIVLPYREGTQSGVATLAAAARIPVLATDVGGLRPQVGDGGLVVRPTAPAFAAGLVELLGDASALVGFHEALSRRPGWAETWAALADQMVAALGRTLSG